MQIGYTFIKLVLLSFFLLKVSFAYGQDLGLDVSPTSCQVVGSEIPMSDLLVINGPDTDLLEGLQVTVTGNFEASEDFFTYTVADNIRGTFDAINGIFTLSGQSTVANYRLALERLFYRSTTENYDRKSINITLSGVDFLVETGHFYQFFAASGISWSDANAAAKTKEIFGLEGYLTTITGSSENQFILDRVSGTAWIGASDVQQEGVWRWVTGPEGLENGGLGRPLTAGFTNWNASEPNNAGNEDFAHMMDWTSPPGRWNDLPNIGGGGQYFPTGYIVEYGGLPGDPNILDQISGTISIDWQRDLDLAGATSVCPNIQGVPYSATALDGHTYSWSVDGGIIASGQNTNEINVNWADTNASASVTVIVSSDLACIYTETLNVRINEQLEPPLPVGDDFVCFIDLAAPQTYSTPFTPGSDYQWNPTNGVVVSGQGTNEVKILWSGPGQGSLYFTESTSTATDICDGDSPTLEVDLREEITSSFSLESVKCFGESNGSALIEVTSAGNTISYDWNVPQGTEIIANQALGLPAGIYSVFVTVDNCEVEFPFEITEPDELSADQPTITNVLCFGQSNGTAEAIVTGGTGDYRYTWSHDPNQTTAFVDNLPAGNHSVEILDENNCQLILNFIITEPELLAVDEIISTLVSCPGGSDGTLEAIVSGGTLPYSFDWEFSPDTESLATGFPKGEYRVIVTDSNGCQATNTQIVEEAIPKVVLPNAFSPNGDQVNDTFGPTTPCDIIFKMEIYNRWGQIIFSTNSSLNQWDGTFNGQPLSIGNYAYAASWVITANDLVIKENKRGEIQLVN